MTIIEQIKAEIERLKSNMDDRDPLAPNQKAGYLFALADVLSFLSTLESEHLADVRKTSPKDLESYAQRVEDYYDVGEERGYLCTHRGDIKDAVIAGAKWQKEQMMSKAVEGEIKDFRFVREINYASAKIEFNSIPKLKEGDEVCIIVKEDSHE